MTAANGVKSARSHPWAAGACVRPLAAGGLPVARGAVGWRGEFRLGIRASRRAIAVASHRQASKSIETICVGQRVVTQDAQANGNSGDAHLISFCCGKSFVAFRSAKGARNSRYFRGAKGDDPANSAFRNRYQ